MLNSTKRIATAFVAIATLLAVPSVAMASETRPALVVQDDQSTSASLAADSASLGVANLAPNDRITRLYRAALGREPDLDGHAYWVGQLNSGATLLGLTNALMDSEEARLKSSGDSLRDAYLWALGREPDAEGYAYWQQLEVAHAVIYISDSAEHKNVTGREVVAGPVADAPLIDSGAPVGWVNAGHGVYVPSILIQIRRCESGGNYLAANRRSSARGAYQFLLSSWAAYGHARRYGVFEAHLASPAQQDEAAVITWQRDGTRPWNASRSCWG